MGNLQLGRVHKSHASTNKMSLSATFLGRDWTTSDNPSCPNTNILIMVQHVGEDKHESKVQKHDKMDKKELTETI